MSALLLTLAIAAADPTPGATPGAPPTAPGAATTTPAHATSLSVEALGNYAAALQRTLAALRSPARKPAGPAAPLVLELRIGADGGLRGLSLSIPAGPRATRDPLLGAVLEADLPAPDASITAACRELTCLARLAPSADKKKPRLDATVACLGPEGTIGPPMGELATLKDAPDAAAALFSAWAAEAAGDAATAAAQLSRAVSAAPDWDLAARSFGLALVKQKRAAAAIPYLRLYATRRGGFADAQALTHEIDRFEHEQAARAAEFTRVRPRLGKDDLVLGIRKGYALLEPCLSRARQARLLEVGTDTLLVTFKVNKDGTVATSQLEGPNKLLMTEPAECVERSLLAWRFPPYSEGSEITAKRVPIKVRGASAEVAPSAVAASAPAPAEVEEPTFSSCERPAAEIGNYVTARTSRVAACLNAELKRNPNGWPDTLPISFVVDAAGPVRNVSLNHRFFREGPLATCIATALAGALGAVGGADCPAELPVDLRSFAARR
jgi:hypothetical protein